MSDAIYETLRFVQGAVGTKQFTPELTHFQIKNGRVTGYNGKLSISAPLALDIDCCPKAVPFVAAIAACEETAKLHLTPKNRLAVRSGKFLAHVETLSEDIYPEVHPEGQPVAIDGELLPVLAMLYDLTADDASRPWAAGVLLDGDSAFATNNVVLVERWLGYRFPYRVNIPRYAIKELLRIGEEPTGLQLTGNSATFHYNGDRWLRTQLNATEWPPLSKVFERLDCTEAPPVPEGFFEALDKLVPFLDVGNRVIFKDGTIHTATEDGASMAVEGLPDTGIYNAKMLLLLEGIATQINFARYPDPVPFFGHKMRGAIAGMSR